MKYLKLYEKFRIFEAEKEDLISKYGTGGDRGVFSGMPDSRSEAGQIARQSQKKLILFSGPSASGKTYLAMHEKSKLKKKFKHWYTDLNASEILIGTDTFLGDAWKKSKPALQKLMENAGLVKYAEIAEGFGDSPWLIEVYAKDLYKKFRSEASEEELKIWDEMNSKVAYNVEKCTGSMKNQEDGRVCGMAWVAYLHPAKTVIFDDVDTAIKKYFPSLHDILCFTPLEEYLTNVKLRINSKIKEERINVGDTDSGIYQYIKWFKAVEAEPRKDAISDYGTGGSGLPSADTEAGQMARAQAVNSEALDRKFYTYQAAKDMLEDTGYNKSEEILGMLGVSKNSSGFYIGKRDNVKCDQVINTRDDASVSSAKI